MPGDAPVRGSHLAHIGAPPVSLVATVWQIQRTRPSLVRCRAVPGLTTATAFRANHRAINAPMDAPKIPLHGAHRCDTECATDAPKRVKNRMGKSYTYIKGGNP